MRETSNYNWRIRKRQDSSNDCLSHYGIPGQKRGHRRFQNEDGTLTEEGKRRYGITDAHTGGKENELRSLLKPAIKKDGPSIDPRDKNHSKKTPNPWSEKPNKSTPWDEKKNQNDFNKLFEKKSNDKKADREKDDKNDKKKKSASEHLKTGAALYLIGKAGQVAVNSAILSNPDRAAVSPFIHSVSMLSLAARGAGLANIGVGVYKAAKKRD